MDAFIAADRTPPQDGRGSQGSGRIATSKMGSEQETSIHE
jgi:hypothetical protein